MKTKLQWGIGIGAVLVIAVCLALLAGGRVQDARQFGQAHQVRTYSGTNYVFQFVEATVGKVDTGCVLIVYARIENPNPFPLTLNRDWFVLMDHDKDYFLPVATSGQTGAITIPAQGMVEKEALSYVVPDDSLQGILAVSIGHYYFARFKSEKPLSRPLEPGKFVTFRQSNW